MGPFGTVARQKRGDILSWNECPALSGRVDRVSGTAADAPVVRQKHFDAGVGEVNLRIGALEASQESSDLARSRHRLALFVS